MEEQQPQASGGGKFAVPAAIVIAGIIIGGALIYSNSSSAPGTASVKETIGEQQAPNDPLENLKPVTDADHIRGNPNAPVKIVEFSDTECPFCKRFHDTMKQVMDEYGKAGLVAWTYRHFPLESLHSKAKKEAEALECANELGGNNAFWTYADRLYEITPSNDGLDLAELPRIAEFVGLNRAQFETCLASSKYASKVQTDYEDAVNAGGMGTPFSIAIAANGTKTLISGAQPYSVVKDTIEQALKK